MASTELLAVGHPFSFPQWNKWWGLGTYGAFTDMAKFKSWSPKKLREWIESNQLEAMMIGFTNDNIPEVDAWASGKGSNSAGGKDDKNGKGGKNGKNGKKPTRTQKVNAARWKEVKAAIKEVSRIDAMGLSYVLGGSHTGSMPGALRTLRLFELHQPHPDGVGHHPRQSLLRL